MLRSRCVRNTVSFFSEGTPGSFTWPNYGGDVVKRRTCQFTCGHLVMTNNVPLIACLHTLQFEAPCSPEEFAVALGQHFVRNYPLVWKAKVLGE